MLRRSLPNLWRLKFWNNWQKTRPLKSWRKHTQIWNIFFRQTVPQFTCVSRMQMSFVRDNICVSHIHTHTQELRLGTTAQLHICLESMSVCPMVKCGAVHSTLKSASGRRRARRCSHEHRCAVCRDVHQEFPFVCVCEVSFGALLKRHHCSRDYRILQL